MPRITTYQNLPLHHRGLLDAYFMFSEGKPNHWKTIVGKELETDELYEELALVSGLAPAQSIREAGGVPFDEITTPFTKKFFADLFAIGVEFSHQVTKKDVYNKLRGPGKLMAQAHYVAHEMGAADVVNNAFSSSYAGIDGVALASASHPTATGTWSNVSTAATLSVGSLETMITDLGLQKAYRDTPWLNMGSWNLVVPVQLDITARRILSSMNQPGTADNDKNVARETINYVRGNPFLTDTNGYCLLPAGEENPIFQLNGIPMTPKEDFDIRTYSHLFATVVERTFGWKWAQGTQFNQGA